MRRERQVCVERVLQWSIAQRTRPAEDYFKEPQRRALPFVHAWSQDRPPGSAVLVGHCQTVWYSCAPQRGYRSRVQFSLDSAEGDSQEHVIATRAVRGHCAGCSWFQALLIWHREFSLDRLCGVGRMPLSSAACACHETNPQSPLLHPGCAQSYLYAGSLC